MCRRLFVAVVLLPFAVGCGNQQPPAPAPQPGLPAPSTSTTPDQPRPTLPAEESDTVRKYKQRVKELGEAAETGRVSLIQELMKAGADVNDKDDAGRTALHKAAAKGQKAACVALLAYGADAGEKDADGVTPLMLAAANGHAEVIELMHSADAVMTAAGDVLKESAKGVIGDRNKFIDRMAKFAFDMGDVTDKQGQTAVHKAAAGGHVECLRALGGLTSGYTRKQFAQPDKSGRTPFMLAAAAGHAAVFDLCLERPVIAVESLAVKGADGKTALDLARDGKHAAVVTRLERFSVLMDAERGDVPAVEKVYKADPKGFPAEEVVLVATRRKDLPLLKAVLGWYADKPVADKTAVLTGPANHDGFPALYAASQQNWTEGVEAMVDPKWWNEAAALKAFVDLKYPNFTHVLDEYYQKTYPGPVAAIRKALDAAEKK